MDDASLHVTTFPYDARWGGGYGWILFAHKGDRQALATSERASRTPERAIAAARRYARTHSLPQR